MKKIFTKSLVLTVLSFAMCFTMHAQNSWNLHQGSNERSAAPAQTTAGGSEIILGHCSVYDQIWPYDGISLSYDARVGVGIKLPTEMIEMYEGCIISAMYVGWDVETEGANYECFVRQGSFNGEDLTTGSGSVVFGWNRIELNSVPLIAGQDLCVGFYTDLKKNVCSIPNIYPGNTPNSIFLYSGETDNNGNELWYDMHRVEGMAKMPIMLVLMDRNGKYANMVDITSFRANTVVWRDDQHSAEIRLKNLGSNEVSKFTVLSSFDGMEMEDVVLLEEPILNADEIRVSIPIYCLGTGVHNFVVTEVNDVTTNYRDTVSFEMIGVPYDLDGVYTKLPLIEYFVSEESYMVPNYLDKMFWPGFKDYEDRFNLVFHHTDDKYMWGDNEALLQMLSLANNDSSLILVPGFTVDRSDHMEYLATLHGSPFHYGTPFPEHVSPMWEGLIDDPTFASVNVNATYEEESEKVKITVSGDVAEGIMPDGEPLYLTVYLMEKNVLSMDQKFWDDNDKAEHSGEYTHKNVVRDILTPYWGEELAQTGGEYSMTFEADTYSDYNLNNLFVVAFLNRGENKHHMSRQIINSAKGSINGLEAVGSITTDKSVTMVVLDGAVYVNGTTENVEVFNLAGAQVANGSLADGVYLVRCNDVVGKVLVR
ncbi:MAG: Omp28-related outer membrane protein [Bacteroidaceae bacterium]|nr:Omp28-related outer membrane protein [Bacteroidaceae bacterium]